MDAIAAQASVSKATLYAYFASKEELFAQIVTSEGERRLHGLDAEDPGEGLAPALDRLAVELATLILSDDTVAMYRIIMSEAANFPDLGARFYEAGPARLLDRLAARLAAAMERGELLRADPHLAASQFIGLILGELQVRALLHVGPQASARQRGDVARQGAALFLRAYGTPVTRKQAASRAMVP